jgi:S1-C subfamily serine protease
VNVIRFPGLCILALMCLLGTNRLQAHADDIEDAKSNARSQIAILDNQIRDTQVALIAADLGIAFAKAALKQEQDKANPDFGKVLALSLAVGLAEEVKSSLLKKQDAQQTDLTDWKTYLDKIPFCPTVSEVLSGSIAERAKFQIGDRIISYDGVSTARPSVGETDLAHLKDSVLSRRGREVRVQVVRDGRVLDIKVRVPEGEILGVKYGLK